MTRAHAFFAAALLLACGLAPAGSAGTITTTLGGSTYVIDNAPLSSADTLSRELGFGIGTTALRAHRAERGPWVGMFRDTGRSDPGGAQGADHTDKGLVAGFGFGRSGVSAFVGFGQGEAKFDDGLHETRFRSYFYGLSLARETGGLHYDVAVYMGNSHNKVMSGPAASGSGDFDGRLYGVALRGTGMLTQGGAGLPALDYAVQANVVTHETEDYPLSGLGGTVDRRSMLSHALRIELGMPMQSGAASLRPYLALTTLGGDQDAITFAASGASTRFGAADVLSGTQAAIGVGFGRGRMQGRAEIAGDTDGNDRMSLSLGWRF
ncbi:hypothetical protein VK792_00080 [Mesobacterium sp. TK19101]|uniref:Autotransporter domain-containing protein n=1 Tax=Mesobacterium hydrothermale TaxID=3111907 RepID=A0ABU6HB31_9RHOB|nr:hypothetical protein [Mesobacterium sp. TK19101]MEC3859665.1 hypothetical protein [Mesobacterium sp. TK19101]